MTDAIVWKLNSMSELIKDMNADELEVFQADMQDAIDGVIEDWDGR
jgi:hypothetical protein